MVTRWRFEGDTLRIETGLIRKDSRRLPLARIQAVDIVRPLLARLLGVSELRIRLAGSGSTDGKLAYLSEAQAAELRPGRCSPGTIDPTQRRSQHGASPWPASTRAACSASVLLSLVSIVLIGTVAALAVLDQFEPRTAAAAAGFLAVYLLSFAGVVWRRLSGQYDFIAVEGARGRPHPARACSRPSPRRCPTGGSRRCARSSPCCGGPSGGAGSRWTSPARRHATSAVRAPASCARRSCRWARSRTPGTCWPACSARPTPRARPHRAGPG